MKNKNSSPPWIVSVAFNWHDSSVAVSHGSHVKLVLEAERVFRVKKLRCNKNQMEQLITLALNEVGISINDVGIWCGTGFGNLWTSDELEVVKDIEFYTIKLFDQKVNVRLINHHRSHAALYFSSPFDQAVIISCDGGGDNEDHVPFIGNGLGLKRLPETETVRKFSSTFYDRASYYLYGQYRQEGKFMGLAGWGEVDEKLKTELIDNIDQICNATEEIGLEHFRKICPIDQFDVQSRKVQNFAATVQKVFEEFRLLTTREYQHNSPNLVLVGGSALNVVANNIILEDAGYDKLFIPPCCDDTGQALGALLDTIAYELGERPQIKYPFLGRGTEETPVRQEEIANIAYALKQGKVIAWHQGRAEIGPRALGHRSLLASPTSEIMKTTVSEHIKQRESYRPVAPIILSEYANQWFDLKAPSPFMNYSVQAKSNCLDLAPAVVHIDGSSRVQTVGSDGDPAIRHLLLEFYEQTGIPMLINTSLNGPGMPICDSVSDTVNWLSTINSDQKNSLLFAVNGKICDLNGVGN